MLPLLKLRLATLLPGASNCSINFPRPQKGLCFFLFIPCSELQRDCRSLCKGFIASFLTSAQMSASLACFFFFPLYHPPLHTFLLLAILVLLLSARRSRTGRWGGFISTEATLLSKGFVLGFFCATHHAVHIQGLVLHNAISLSLPHNRKQTHPLRGPSPEIVFAGAEGRYAEQKSSEIGILPLQILVIQASYRGLSTVMACRGKMDFKMIIGMTHVAFSPFLLTHNLAATAEFSSHLKFPCNSQEAHVNSDDIFRRAVSKGVSFPEAF